MDDGLNDLARQIAALSAAATGKTIDAPDGSKIMLIPQGFTYQKLPQVNPPEPELLRIKGSVVLHDVDSFVAYVERYKGPATRIFAEPGFLCEGGKARVTAIFDYHEKEAPHHCNHSAIYSPRYSDQWSRWAKASVFEQVPFAEWIEENRADISSPPAASLLDIVRTFKASKKVEFDSVVYTNDGSVKLGYSETTEGKGSQSSAMPEIFTLGIPVYFRGERYAVGVWVRYRVANGKVVFTLKLDRPDVIEDDAFNKLVADISAKTSIDAYLGRKV